MTTNGHVVCGALRSILLDFEAHYTNDIVSMLSEDIDDLEARVNTRGYGVIMIDLPKLGKVYDKALSTGFLPKDFTFPRSLLRTKKQPIFGRLFGLSFRQGKLSNPEPEVVKYTRALLYAYKKARMDCPSNVVKKAHHAYFELDMSLRWPTHDWWDIGPGPKFRERTSFASGFESERGPFKGLLDVLDGVCGWITPATSPELEDLAGRHGPGAVSDLRGGEDKYVFPTWPDSLARKFPPGQMMTIWGLSELGTPNSWGGEPRSKLIAVPKTLDKPRLIASEPTALMWCQQALLTWLRKNTTPLIRSCVDFFSQDPSRDLALQSSIDGRMVTVDLESASDRLSLWTVERAFASNPELLEFLASARSFTTYSELVGREARMRKFAAQGSALTFYVQSVIYTACAIAAVLYSNGVRTKEGITKAAITKAANVVRVFGDDIVTTKESLVFLGVLFEFLELKIGMDKTHSEGNFRESCGMDAYFGFQVTPPYLPYITPKWDTLELASWCGVHNHVHALGGFDNLCKYMRSLIPERTMGRLFVSKVPQAGLWLRTEEDVVKYPNRGRWNTDLQTWEYQALCVELLASRGVRESYTNLLQYFTEAYSEQRVSATEGIDLMDLSGFTKAGFYRTRRARLGKAWVSEV